MIKDFKRKLNRKATASIFSTKKAGTGLEFQLNREEKGMKERKETNTAYIYCRVTCNSSSRKSSLSLTLTLK